MYLRVQNILVYVYETQLNSVQIVYTKCKNTNIQQNVLLLNRIQNTPNF